jgi:hypothetical protein
MIKLSGSRVNNSILDKHIHICDFINMGIPTLSLYSDGRRNWIYLWCDTDNVDTHRWLLFRTTREDLSAYLNKEKSLLELINSNQQSYILDLVILKSAEEEIKIEDATVSYRRFLTRLDDIHQIDDYLPTSDSFFDPELTCDIALGNELMPSTYEVPITGTWFSGDFENLFRSYERVYAFFYSTRPRFVRTVGDKLAALLRAPWTGGFSRVHLFSQLALNLPAIHSLKIHKFQFASPGEVEFQALSSVGESIKIATLNYLDNEIELQQAVKLMKAFLTNRNLNKANLSTKSDSEIGLHADEVSMLKSKCFEIADLLKMNDEMTSLQKHSPNSVVFSKATTSFVKQISKLAELEASDMLNFRKKIDVD